MSDPFSSDPFSLERQPGSRPPTDLAPASPDFFQIQVAQLPVPVRIEYAAIRELQRQLAGEGESVGLLVGSSTPDALSIQHCEVLAVSPGATGDPKQLVGAFRQSLASRSQTQPLDAPQLLGCFRTQVGGWPGMKEADLGMVKRAFLGSDTFFILIRTTSHRPWLAALYALDAKTTTTSVEPALEFPFDEYLLRKGYLTDLVETSESVDVQEKPKKSKTPWIVAGLVFAILLVGSAAAFKFKWFRVEDQTEVAVNKAPTPVLNLKVNRSGKDFEISWDRLSAPVQQASGGMLTITDGALTRPVALNASQLREGRILYTPLFEELNFRLEVVTPELGTAAESVQVLAWSGKQPADTLKATAPDPSANIPARIPVAGGVSDPVKNPLPTSVPSPAIPKPVKQPPAVKQAQPAKPVSVPETVAVVQPAPSSAVPSSVGPAPAPTPAPVITPPPPAAAAPRAEAPLVVSNVVPNPPKATTPLPPPPVAPPVVPVTAPSVSPTATAASTVTPPVPTQRVAATLPRGIPSGSTAGGPKVISVRVMVDSAGSVQSAEVTASSPKGAFGEAVLKSAALDAAKRWKFRPGQVNGRNVAAEYSIDFKFE